MSNVIQLFKAVEIWECICGSQSFNLFSNGDVECTECELVSNSQRCFWVDKDA